MTNQSLPPDAPRPSRKAMGRTRPCESCGFSTHHYCTDCQAAVCGPCFGNIHLQATGCFGVYDNDAQPSWYGLASGLARRAQ